MKKLPTLHILNGDASLSAFEAAKLPGQVLVWREILSEGPAIASLPEHEFWQMRQKYLAETYGETAEAYKQKVLDELPKLDAAGAFFEVVLWFDADLMCQVNLLYLLHRLFGLQPASVFVCTPPLPESIAQLEPASFQKLFENRQKQTREQLTEAHKLWQMYAGPDPMKLQHHLKNDLSVSHHLVQALLLHLSRFPDCKNGLGQPETALLKLIEEGAETKEQLLIRFWQHYPAYGFGDWQLLQLLKSLQPELVCDMENLKLSPIGKQVLQEETYFSARTEWLGGYKIDAANNLCYNHLARCLQIFS